MNDRPFDIFRDGAAANGAHYPGDRDHFPMQRSAVISDDGVYRYELTRFWGDPSAFVKRYLTFVMLNPSTANGEVDDRTIGRCMEFARREGYDGIRVVNLYAARTTRPVHLWDGTIPDPVGPENRRYLTKALLRSYNIIGPVVVAWGAGAKPDQVDRFKAEAARLHVQLVALHVNADGSPKHPLYIKGDAPLVEWQGRGL